MPSVPSRRVCALFAWFAGFAAAGHAAAPGDVAAAPDVAAVLGIVVAVHDGDTLTVATPDGPVRVRLAGIDAPERAQSRGEAARESLGELCARRAATVTVAGRDRYGRVLAAVSCDGVAVNREQVRRGWAWVYARYVRADDPLHEIERKARAERRGLWADAAPLPPWEWRNLKDGTERVGKRRDRQAASGVSYRTVSARFFADLRPAMILA